MIPTLLTIEDIMKTLGIGRGTAYKIAKAIKHTKVGRRILVEEQELLDYIRNTAADGLNTLNYNEKQI